MQFDILSTIELTANAALLIAFLAFVFAATPQRRLGLAAVLSGWFAVVLLFGVTGALGAHPWAGAAGLPVAVMLPFALMCAAFLTQDRVHAALMATPLYILVAAHISRIVGVSFVLLYAAHRLPAPFAPSAGWGDIFVGLAAIPLTFAAARYGVRAKPLLLAWNTIGVIDLVLAIGFGATSSPGPIQMFAVSPDSSLMTTLPWILVPVFLVPFYLALHVAIFYRLRAPAMQARLAA